MKLRGKTRSLAFTALIVGSIFAIAAAVRPGQPEDVPGPAGSGRRPVRVVQLAERRLDTVVHEGGFFKARRDVTLSAERAGRVVRFPVREGGRVEAGTVVVDLEDTVARARLEEARILAREADLDPATPAAQRARVHAQLRLAQNDFDLHHLRSPIDGLVEIHHVDAGEYVTPGTPLVDVIDPALLALEVEVSSEIVGALRPGGKVPVQVLGEAGMHEGRIARIDGRANARTHRFGVEIEVEAAQGPLRPGMYARATFRYDSAQPGLYLPKEAVRTLREERGVFRIVDGRAQWTPVRVEETPAHPGLWRVLQEDLSPGDEVVVAQFTGLATGVEVQVLR